MFSIKDRTREEMKTIVSPSETISLILRQSLLHSISPSAIVLTDRRVVIIHHSFWGLYLKFNLVSPTEINVVQHKNIMSVALTRGKFFGTTRVRILGFESTTPVVKYEWDIDGLWIKDAVDANNEIGRIIEERSEAQDAKMSNANLKGDETGEDNAKISKEEARVDNEVPVAYVVKNDKIVATEKIEVMQKENYKIFGRFLGILIIITAILGLISSFGYDPLPYLQARMFLSITSSVFLFIIGLLLIKLA